jgi:hypothetical protein
MLQNINSSSRWTTAYAFGKDSVVPAQGPVNFWQFIRQKLRHISAGKYFPLRNKTAYALFHTANLMLWCSIFYSLFSDIRLAFFWLAKIVMDYAMIRIFAHKVNCTFSPLVFLPWEAAFAGYHVLASPMTVLEKRKW